MAKRTAPKIYVINYISTPGGFSCDIRGVFYDLDLARKTCKDLGYGKVVEIVPDSVPMKFKKAHR